MWASWKSYPRSSDSQSQVLFCDTPRYLLGPGANATADCWSAEKKAVAKQIKLCHLNSESTHTLLNTKSPLKIQFSSKSIMSSAKPAHEIVVTSLTSTGPYLEWCGLILWPFSREPAQISLWTSRQSFSANTRINQVFVFYQRRSLCTRAHASTTLAKQSLQLRYSWATGTSFNHVIPCEIDFGWTSVRPAVSAHHELASCWSRIPRYHMIEQCTRISWISRL